MVTDSGDFQSSGKGLVVDGFVGRRPGFTPWGNGQTMSLGRCMHSCIHSSNVHQNVLCACTSPGSGDILVNKTDLKTTTTTTHFLHIPFHRVRLSPPAPPAPPALGCDPPPVPEFSHSRETLSCSKL